MQEIFEKYNLPREVHILIQKSEDNKYFIELPEYEGLFTEADSLSEIFENITDAILTYFDVPRDIAQDSPVIYVPATRERSEVKVEKTEPTELNLGRFTFA